jgi:hypothetical protein
LPFLAFFWSVGWSGLLPLLYLIAGDILDFYVGLFVGMFSGVGWLGVGFINIYFKGIGLTVL